MNENNGYNEDCGLGRGCDRRESNLKSTPSVEVLDAPETLSVAVKEAMLLPRRQNCSKTVTGGVLQMTAKDVKEISTTRVVLRVKYPTRDGDRVRGYNYNVTIVP